MTDKATAETKQFELVSSGFDEYPGDGLRFKAEGERFLHDKTFCSLDLQEGDIVEVTVKVISRIVPATRVTL